MKTSSNPAKQRAPVAILGVPFDVVTTKETIDRIAGMVASGEPHYIATANVDFLVQALEDVELRRILFDAHLILGDGMPIVWASRVLGNALPERVTGSDLVPRLLAEAEARGWRVFFLGGTEESVALAAEKTRQKHPRLALVGAYSPPFKPLLEMDHADILRKLEEARPDLLFVAFGCPKQEKWLNLNFRQARVPVGIGVGATIDFLAGTFRRAPVWMQKTGLEWLFRICQEPRRLAGRYGKGFWVFGRAILRQWWQMRSRRKGSSSPGRIAIQSSLPDFVVVQAPPHLDAAAVKREQGHWEAAVDTSHVLFQFTDQGFADSTGVGALIRLQKRARNRGTRLILVSVPPQLDEAIKLMRLEGMFDIAQSLEQAKERNLATPGPADLVRVEAGTEKVIRWRGEITAVNAETVAGETEAQLADAASRTEATIDLAAVPFLDSSGVGVMVRMKKVLWQRQIKVTFINPVPAVCNVIKLTRLDEYLLGRKL